MRAGLFDRRDGAAGDHPDAVLLHVLAQVLAHVVVKPAQNVFAAIDQRHVRAEAGKNAGEFDRDIAAALDHHAARQFRQVERLVGRDRVLDAGDFVAVAWRSAGRDQNMRRPDAIAVRHLHGVGIGQRGAVLDDFDAGLRQERAIGRLQPRDLLVLVGDQRRPVERGVRHGPAEAGGILEFAVEARGIDQKLLRHAAADDAGAAEAIFLRQHHARAVLRGNARGAHAARAAADDEQIDVEIRHATYRVRASSFRRVTCS